MIDLSALPARRCLTAAGILVVSHQVLLVHHKKLNIWLPPGGHVKVHELPHQAAEREFFEETGIKVTVVSANQLLPSTESSYLPTPLAINLHWISEINYHHRLHRNLSSNESKLCEQHYTLIYFVTSIAGNTISFNQEESYDCRWFKQSEIASLDTTNDVKNELHFAIDYNGELSQ